MTSVLMIFEMTRDYSVIVPLMIANLVSLYISSKFQKQPIYEALAQQDAIHLPSRKVREEPGQRRVADLMRNAIEVLPAEMSVQQAFEQTLSSQFRT
jgi:CIC family chloride channel protein